MNFAELVGAYRERTGVTQAVLADSLGISRTYLSSIERGKANNLSFALAMKLLNLAGMAHGQLEVTLTRRVWVDATIALEIVWLNESGVETVGCCVGSPATALISPSSVVRAEELGYLPLYVEDSGLFVIELRSVQDAV